MPGSAGAFMTASSGDEQALTGTVLERQQQGEVLAQLAREQEVLAHEPPRLGPEFGDGVRAVQQVADPERGALGRVHEEARVEIEYLQPDPARVAADDGFALPHGLGDGEPEALTQRLLPQRAGA